jgi:pyruvate dehydrogenase E2 component (dihydrolipoamide acetyltransferase)
VSTSGPKGEVRVVQPTPAERTIARRVAESRATIPDLELTVALEVDPPAAPIDTARLLSACGASLREHPRVNAAYRDGQFEIYSRINIGLIVSGEDSYLIPTVFDADVKTRDELASEIEGLRTQAATGELAPPAFSGATFTVWNASELGIAQATIPVVPPQAAVLTAGTTSLNLVCDHRILYGSAAAGFLTALKRRLEREE